MELRNGLTEYLSGTTRERYNVISRDATNEADTITEALEKYGQLSASIEKNLPISADARKLEHYIGMFIETRAKNAERRSPITPEPT